MSISHASALSMVALIGCIGMATVRDLHAAAASEGQPEQAASAPAEQSAQAEPVGLSLITDRCTACHGTDQIFLQRKSPEEWKDTVQTMIDRGTDVTVAEEKAIIQYLIENYSS